MTRVSGLHCVGFIVPDLRAAEDFYYRLWAMRSVPAQGPALYFRSRCVEHPEIMLQAGDKPGLQHVAFSVLNEEDLSSLLNLAAGAGATIVDRPSWSERPGSGRVAAFLDLDGNRVELVVPARMHVSSLDADGPIGPKKLGHVVFWTPQRTAQEAFYAALGFQVTDRTHAGMSFMRCNQDHHTLALVDSKNNRVGVQHTSFDVGTVDDVMREFGRLRDAGAKCIWGVGRHGPGRNVFSYYNDPAGNIVEFYGDMDEFPESVNLEPTYWGREHKGDIWGVAGRPPRSFTE